MKLLKTLVISVLAVSLILGIALPALANSKAAATQPAIASTKPDEEKENSRDKVQIITGNVTAINGAIITVNGKDITTNGDTKYKVPGVKDATLANIQVGTNVVAQTRANSSTLVARQIVVVPKRPIAVAHTGNVTAFNYNPTTGGSISIQDKSLTVYTFDIVAGKFNVLPRGAAVAVGKMVTVKGYSNPGGQHLVATSVTVLPPPLQTISGTITAINEISSDNGTITIGATTLKYNGKTVIALRNAGLGVKVGQTATAWYRNYDGELRATRVQIGVWPAPKPKPVVAARKAIND